MSDVINHNPDILTCLANLSNDEVFTPPELANKLLDLIPEDFWKDPNVKILDPACKSGVILREAAKRFIKGLEPVIPDLQKRLDHIFHNQLFGMAITELTSYMSRRSLYCSKYANGRYSIATFKQEQGNIVYKNIKHTWSNDGKCIFCGAPKELFNRTNEQELHAYEFIHLTHKKIEELKDMKFDLIISNPPYQLGDSGAFASASPIYQKFVKTAKTLSPRYVTMIIPARWYAGGKGLDGFRKDMLTDSRIRTLHDFPIGADCFPGTRIAGGVCYFLWTRDSHGPCTIYNHKGNEIISQMTRPLLENGEDTFVRLNNAISILRKVKALKEPSFASIVSARKPFGLASDFFANPAKYELPKISDTKFEGAISIVGTLKYKTTTKYVPKNYPFPAGLDLLPKYKVFVSQVLDAGFDMTKERLKPFIGCPNEACTETFLTVGNYSTKEEAENVISYMNTNFFHLLMHLKKVSHHVTAKVYGFIPLQDFSKPWTDKELYKKYNLTDEEVTFIESTIKPMDLGDNNE